MPSYIYTARETATGREIRNAVEAATEQAAIAALLNRNLLVVSIQEKDLKKGQDPGRQSQPGRPGHFYAAIGHHGGRRYYHRPIPPGAGRAGTDKVMRDTVRDVSTRVESGESLSEALQKHPKAFSKLYVSMVGGGRKRRFARGNSRRGWPLTWKIPNRLRKKVKTALMYPDYGHGRGDRYHDLPVGTRHSYV